MLQGDCSRSDVMEERSSDRFMKLFFILTTVIYQFNSIQFIYLCLKHTYMQIIIKMQRRPAKGYHNIDSTPNT